MTIDHPSLHHLPQLRSLWQQVFGDTDAFLDSFYRTAYAPDHCLCILLDNQVAAALYWIDCTLDTQRLAYIYAVVTHPDHRGKGLCRMLMTRTHAILTDRGYAGTLLVPQNESLRRMYAGMGYENAGGLNELVCTAGESAVSLRAVGPGEFAALRRKWVPSGTVVQEGAGLSFLAEQVQFYAGQNFLLAAYADQETVFAPEFLGDAAALPGILKALGFSRGVFRMPGCEKDFAMFHGFSGNAIAPEYFGFAYD